MLLLQDAVQSASQPLFVHEGQEDDRLPIFVARFQVKPQDAQSMGPDKQCTFAVSFFKRKPAIVDKDKDLVHDFRMGFGSKTPLVSATSPFL